MRAILSACRDAAAVTVAGVLFALVSGAASAQSVTEFPLPSGSGPLGITAGPDGNVWFATQTTGTIGRITPAGTITQFSAPTAGSGTSSIATGSDGNLWFTENNANKIGRFTPGPNTMTEFQIVGSRTPTAITASADGFLWFTLLNPAQIATVHLDGSMAKFNLTANSAPVGVAAFNDPYYVWLTEFSAGKLAKVDRFGDIVEMPSPHSPNRITAGPDGNLWFTESGTNMIGTVTAAGAVREFMVPSLGGYPIGIVAGSDGNLWFTENGANKIGRISTSGVFAEYPVPTANAQPIEITSGPDGNLWFTEQGTNQIGRLVPPPSTSPLVASILPASRSVQTGATATVFASIVNAGTTAASGCAPAIVSPTPVTFSYQTTSPTTNALTGTPNTRVAIPAGGFQTFVLVLATRHSTVPVDVTFGYDCSGVDAVATLVGINTLKMVIDDNPVPDMIAIGLTPSGGGISRTGGVGGTGFFAIATDNIGASASLTARVRLSDSSIPVTATICKTNPSTGACTTPAGATTTSTVAQNETGTYLASLVATGNVPLDAAKTRAFVEFVDASGIVRGSTSCAVTTTQ